MNTNAERKRRESQGGFTMIEIAICIAVVAFALVAIIGILPSGMTVQRDNREDTILNQEGAYWMEAIRGGARGIDDLTNYVEAITITNSALGIPLVINTANTPLTGQMIIGLLSTPKTTLIKGVLVTNRVTARVKAMTGSASEKGALTNDASFRYELQSEVISHLPSLPPSLIFTNDLTGLRAQNLAYNLHDVRLVIRWPLFERGTEWATGSNRKYIRSAVAGGLASDTNVVLPANLVSSGLMAYFLKQNSFTNVTPLQ